MSDNTIVYARQGAHLNIGLMYREMPDGYEFSLYKDTCFGVRSARLMVAALHIEGMGWVDSCLAVLDHLNREIDKQVSEEVLADFVRGNPKNDDVIPSELAEFYARKERAREGTNVRPFVRAADLMEVPVPVYAVQ